MNEFTQALRLAPDAPLANYYYKAAALGGADVKKAAAEE